MSSYPPTPSKRSNASPLLPPSARRASSADSASHTIIDPFGSLLRSHQGLENINIKTPKTPVDPLYRHPFHSDSVGDDDKATGACSALPNSVSSSSPQQGSHHHHRSSNTPVTPTRNTRTTSSSNPYITPPSVVYVDHVSQQTTTCRAYPTKLKSSNSAQAHAVCEVRPLLDDSRLNIAFTSNTNSTDDLTLDDAPFKEDTSTREDRSSSDEDMVMCEPSGLISLLSRSFQFLFSRLQGPRCPLVVEVQEDKRRDHEEKEASVYDDDDDSSSVDDDSQDSALHSQPASPQTPLCYSHTSWSGVDAIQTRFPPPPPPIMPVFYYPCSGMPSQHHGHPSYTRLPPNWLPWRSANENQGRGGPLPLLPTLSPSHDDNDHHGHRGNSFPILPPRPLSQCRWAAMQQQGDWIKAKESPMPALTTSPPPLIRPVPALAPPASHHHHHHHPMHSMTTTLMGPSIRCPISGGIMLEPVIDPDGFSYEKSAILEWLSKHTTSPITNRLLTPNELRPNRTLQCVIQNLLQNMNTK